VYPSLGIDRVQVGHRDVSVGARWLPLCCTGVCVYVSVGGGERIVGSTAQFVLLKLPAHSGQDSVANA
jgi:hypothetical protein